MNNKQIVGIGLILLGALFLVKWFFDIQGILFIAGAGFFILLYFKNGGNSRYRNIGFLIPSLVLLWLSVTMVFEYSRAFRAIEDYYTFFGLGTIFLAICLVHTAWFKFSPSGKRFWPLIVAGALYFFGCLELVENYVDEAIVQSAFKFGGPIILILLGLVLVFKGVATTGSENIKEEKEKIE